MSGIAHRRAAQIGPMASGPATVTGVVREIATPVSGRLVVLVEQSSMRARRVTITGAGGVYSIEKLPAGRQWLVLAVDPAGAYNAVVADRVQT